MISEVTPTAFFTSLHTPIGELLLFGDGEALHAINLPGRHESTAGAIERAEELAEPVTQLTEYFAGQRTEFDLKLGPSGGTFDHLVWDEVARIPYGETASYGRVAAAIGHPDAFRAVGASNGRNPLPIVVACHRVIGSNGGLVGYGGGLEAKRTLLDLESGGVQQRLL